MGSSHAGCTKYQGLSQGIIIPLLTETVVQCARGRPYLSIADAEPTYVADRAAGYGQQPMPSEKSLLVSRQIVDERPTVPVTSHHEAGRHVLAEQRNSLGVQTVTHRQCAGAVVAVRRQW